MEEIIKDIFYTGSQDPHRKLFDQLIPLPLGTTYNSFLIRGSEKTALIDTVYPDKINELLKKLEDAGINKIDYIISNHGEQDHSGGIPAVLEKFPEAIIVTNAKCKELIQLMLHVADDKFNIVDAKSEISLGNKTLKFIPAPWVHWPDTMFMHIVEDNILFTTDFLGAHYPTIEIWSTDSEEVIEAAKRYYAEIMMPFRQFAAKYTAQIKDLKPAMIFPSHGPLYKNPDVILNAYTEWTSPEPKNKVVIPYVSMYGSVEAMAKHLQAALEERGIETELFDAVNSDLGDIAMSLIDAKTIVIGASMVLAGPHPTASYVAALIGALRPSAKYVSLIGSYGWGGILAEKIFDSLKNLSATKIDELVIKGAPQQADFEELDKLADKIAQLMRN